MKDARLVFLRAVELRKQGGTAFTMRKQFVNEGMSEEVIDQALHLFEIYRDWLTKRALGFALIIFGVIAGLLARSYFFDFVQKEQDVFKWLSAFMMVLALAAIVFGIVWIVKASMQISKMKQKI